LWTVSCGWVAARGNDGPPSIVSQPQSVDVLSGANVTFSVTANGTALTYQWLENNVDIAGQTSSTLLLTNVTSRNQGTYAVVVSNAFADLHSRELREWHAFNRRIGLADADDQSCREQRCFVLAGFGQRVRTANGNFAWHELE
jgi:hypothetical protein